MSEFGERDGIEIFVIFVVFFIVAAVIMLSRKACKAPVVFSSHHNASFECKFENNLENLTKLSLNVQWNLIKNYCRTSYCLFLEKCLHFY